MQHPDIHMHVCIDSRKEFEMYSPHTVGELLDDQKGRRKKASEIDDTVNGYVSEIVGYPVDYSQIIQDAFKHDRTVERTRLVTGQHIATPSLRMLKTIGWIHALEPYGLDADYTPRQWTVDKCVGPDKDGDGTKPGFVQPWLVSWNNGRLIHYKTSLLKNPSSAENKTLRAINVDGITDQKLLAIIEEFPDCFPEGTAAMTLPEFHNGLFFATGLVGHIPDRGDYDRDVVQALFLRKQPPRGDVRQASFATIDEEGYQKGFVRYKDLYSQIADKIKQAYESGDTEFINRTLSQFRPTQSLYYEHAPWYFPTYALSDMGIVENFDNSPDIMNKPKKGIAHFSGKTGIAPTILHEAWLTGIQENDNQCIITVNSSDYTPGLINANSIPVDLIGNPWLMNQYMGHIEQRIHEFI